MLTPDELADLHAGLRSRSRRYGRASQLTSWYPRAVKDAVRRAITLRTSEVLAPGSAQGVGALLVAGLARYVVLADDLPLSVHQEALARELVWCAVQAADAGDEPALIDAIRSLVQILRTELGESLSPVADRDRGDAA